MIAVMVAFRTEPICGAPAPWALRPTGPSSPFSGSRSVCPRSPDAPAAWSRQEIVTCYTVSAPEGGSSGTGGSSSDPFANMFTARILFVASSAATLYASDSVG